MKINGYLVATSDEPAMLRAVQQAALESLKKSPATSAALILRHVLHWRDAFGNPPDVSALTYQMVGEALGLKATKVRQHVASGERRASWLFRHRYINFNARRPDDPNPAPVLYTARVMCRALVVARQRLEVRRELQGERQAAAVRARTQDSLDSWIKDALRTEWDAALAAGEVFTVSAAELDRVVRPFRGGRAGKDQTWAT